MKHFRIAVSLFTALMIVATVASAGQDKQVEVIVYPILIQAPIFGASIDLPSVPSVPGDGGESGHQGGSTEVSLNTLYMAALGVRAPRWFTEARGQWADLTASRAAPGVTLNTKARFFTVRGGPTLGKGFSATVGLRRIWGVLDATLEVPSLGRTLSGSVDKALYDPLVGIDWRRRAGSFIVEGNFQGGGFGVGTDADVSSEINASWRFTPHTDIRVGYGFFYYKISSDPIAIGSFSRSLVTSQTLHGPTVGFAIVF
jgi:hypothetical protein